MLRPWQAVLAVGLLASLAGWLATAHGVNYYWDESYFAGYALALRSGLGQSIPISGYAALDLRSLNTAWPPLYPLLIAALPFTGPLDSLRFAGIMGLGFSAALTTLLSWRVCRQVWASVIAGLAFVAIPSVLTDTFARGSSEALFMPLIIGATVAATVYRFGTVQRLWPSIVAALLLALAAATRTLVVGITLPLVAYLLLWGLHTPGRSWLRRLAPALLVVLSLVPLFIWLKSMQTTTGSTTGMFTLSLDLKFGDVARSLRELTLQFTAPFDQIFGAAGLQSNWWSLAAMGAVTIVLAWYAWKQRRAIRASLTSLDLLCGFSAAGYLLVFWGMSLVITVTLAQEPRYFVPVYPALLALLAHGLSKARLPRGWVLVIVLLISISIMATVARNAQGLWWNTPDRRSDPRLSQLSQQIPDDALVIGMGAPQISMLLPNRPIRMFGGADYLAYACSDLVYPEPYTRAAFVLLHGGHDDYFMNSRTDSEIDAFFTEWFAPCGQVTETLHSPSSAIILAELAPR